MIRMEAGSAAPRVDWPVYPRRAEHNTVAKGGNRRWADPTAFRRPAKEAAPDMQGKLL